MMAATISQSPDSIFQSMLACVLLSSKWDFLVWNLLRIRRIAARLRAARMLRILSRIEEFDLVRHDFRHPTF